MSARPYRNREGQGQEAGTPGSPAVHGGMHGRTNTPDSSAASFLMQNSFLESPSNGFYSGRIARPERAVLDHATPATR